MIYQWNGVFLWLLCCFLFNPRLEGSKASRLKKGKALDFTIRLRDERSGKPKIIVLGKLLANNLTQTSNKHNQQNNQPASAQPIIIFTDESGEDDAEFWNLLGGKIAISDIFCYYLSFSFNFDDHLHVASNDGTAHDEIKKMLEAPHKLFRYAVIELSQ